MEGWHEESWIVIHQINKFAFLFPVGNRVNSQVLKCTDKEGEGEESIGIRKFSVRQ